MCLGNICRSPTAEGVFRRLAAEEAPALALAVDSAGTGEYHLGEPPDRRSQRAAAARGYDLSGLRARQVEPGDFARFDLILAMDRENLRALEAMRPAQAKAEVGLFTDLAGLPGHQEVPDPYMGDADGFERVLDLVTDASRALLDKLKKQLPPQRQLRGS